ncbi:MAG: YjbH domain-containing protein [Bacillati bacterium ANGP1]|uniref:YjbH domain-containing protein n=1 Tax=Candidatus Segetimicrobium genomatis TaxID=2569760 RepID=A0A537LBX2_9BACT|nr:MAG: YjbH domain-containing protein [Terrabacteria group bacterium ANGP1]
MPPVLEDVIVYGRRFQLTIDGPDAMRRFSAVMIEVATGRVLTRTPVRGRSTADARDRALEVMHNLLGIERFHEQVRAVAARLAPGAAVDLTEDAQMLHAGVSGAWELSVPLVVARDDVTDPEADPQVLRERIEAHFRAHLRRVNA